MMVRKIITHAASVVARNKKGRVRVLGRGARSKIKRYSLPASLSGSSTNVPLHVWRGNRGQHKRKVIRTQGYDAHHQKKTLQTAALQQECSHPHRKRVGIGRRGKGILSRYYWSFFHQET